MQGHGPAAYDHRGVDGLGQLKALGLSSAMIDRNVILFLAADRDGTTRRPIEEECVAIERELRMTGGRHDLEFESRWAITVDDVMHHLNDLEPRVVHVSGQLADEYGQPRHMTTALTRMISSAAPSTRVVVLNACFSQSIAESLCGVVDCVVGMRAIGDEAAHSFAVSFYRALGYRRSVGNAIAQAVATLAAKEFPDEHFPVCVTREGVSANEIVLSR
jgi:hypothetical protein